MTKCGRRHVLSRPPSTTRIIRRQYSHPDFRRRRVSFFDGAEEGQGRDAQVEPPRRTTVAADQSQVESQETNDIDHQRYIRSLLAQDPPSGVYRAETLPTGQVVYHKIKDLSDDEEDRGMFVLQCLAFAHLLILRRPTIPSPGFIAATTRTHVY